MKHMFTPEGVRELRTAWALLAVSILVAAGIAAGSKWSTDRERRESASAGIRLQQARARLDAARRERDSLQESAEVFGGLVERGLLRPERRLELVEMVDDMRARHGLSGLDYDIAPQRALQLPGGRVFPAVDVLASRVKLRMRALHEGDVLAFVAELGASDTGFYLVDRCNLRRLPVAPGGDALQARIDAECFFEWITLKDKNASRPG